MASFRLVPVTMYLSPSRMFTLALPPTLIIATPKSVGSMVIPAAVVAVASPLPLLMP